jgi:hypothetical protein
MFFSFAEKNQKNLNEGKSWWERHRKVSLKPFQRLGVSRLRNGGRSSQRAKSPLRRFSFANFFF